MKNFNLECLLLNDKGIDFLLEPNCFSKLLLARLSDWLLKIWTKTKTFITRVGVKDEEWKEVSDLDQVVSLIRGICQRNTPGSWPFDFKSLNSTHYPSLAR